MPETQDSVHELDAQPTAPRKRSIISDAERRARKNDTQKLVRWLGKGGRVTRDTDPVVRWCRAGRTGHVYNTHVCERALKRNEIVLVDGSRSTYALHPDRMPKEL